jgi:uncharacterized heparinase superfamily protein
VLLFVKVRNSLELFWETLDASERATVAYALAWLLVIAAASVLRSSRERLKAELRAELEADGADR